MFGSKLIAMNSCLVKVYSTHRIKRLTEAYALDMETGSTSSAASEILTQFFNSLPKERMDRLLAIAAKMPTKK
jgi:hypothetical protein